MSEFILFNSSSMNRGLSSIASSGSKRGLRFLGVKFFSVLLLLLIGSGEIWGQIAQFNFPATNSLDVSSKDANVSVSNIALSTGTIETNITTGKYFPNEPYIEESTGWTADNQTASKNFYFTITATSGYQFSITSISFRAYATGAGPTAFGFAIGSNNIYSTNATDSEVVVVNQSVSGQSDLTSATIKIQGWLNGSRTSTGSGEFRLDDVIIEGTVSSVPTISAPSPTSLSGFTTATGTTSSAQTFTIGGLNLTNNLLITAPTNYEIRENGIGTFGSTVSFTPASGTVEAKTIEVRIAASASAGSSSGNVVCSSTGASSQNVAVSGTVSLPAPTANAATNPITMGFVANWDAVNGVSEYKLDVYTLSTVTATDLFISEYVEGTSDNKYIEIFNGTGMSIDLSNYKLQLYTNGSPTPTIDNTLSGTLSNGSTIVYKNSAATIYYGSAITNTAVNFNGNDAVVLFKISTSSYVDIIGRIGEDPVTGWVSNSFSTLNKTLVRKSTVISGVTTNPSSGFPSLNTEWDVYDLDIVSNLGSHTFNVNGESIVSSYNNLTVYGTSKFIMGLSPNSTYYYRVRAVEGNTTSENSNTVTAITALLSSVNASTFADCPTCDIVITNSGTLNINSSKTYKSVSVTPGGKLTLGNGNTLTAAIALQSSALGTGTFVDENTADVPTAVTGTVEQYLTSGRNWYISMPITTGTTAALSTATSVQYWDELIGDWAILDSGEALDPVRGYISVATNQTQAITFSGTLNSGKKEIALTRTTGKTKEGFNLVGNPYPSYLNWTAEIATAANVLPSIWYRTKTGSTYEFYTYNADGVVGVPTNALGIIPPMQAFWVRANAGGGTLTFNNTMRTHGDGSINLLKAPAVAQPILRLKVTGSLNTDETVVYFNSKALNGYDSYDSPKMAGSNTTSEIYTMAGSEELVINGMKNYTLNSEIPLGFRPGTGSGFSIKTSEFSNFDSDIRVFLKDANGNKEEDITDKEYHITDATASTNRFSIIFKTISITTDLENDENQQIVISKNANNQITVNCEGNLSYENSVTVYNAIGQKIITKKMTSTSTVLDIPNASGVYLVTVINAGNKITRKVILN